MLLLMCAASLLPLVVQRALPQRSTINHRCMQSSQLLLSSWQHLWQRLY